MAKDRTKYVMSRHARRRCQQRGVPGTLAAALMDSADRSVPVGEGCEAISLSRRGAARLRRLGWPAALLERLVRIVAVLSPAGEVVTVMHAYARRYRRAWE